MDDVPPDAVQLAALAALFGRGRVAVLSGAGISTASGIPDYRGPETRKRARNPVQYRDFLHSEAARARYWTRSALGYPRVASAEPNRSHHALVQLERRGFLSGLMTQNVDGLHRRAGHGPHVELHGAIREVVCLGCGVVTDRDALQARFREEYSALLARVAETAPDGDAELTRDDEGMLAEVLCADCGGVLKPHVVFFGENVPKDRVAAAFAHVDDAHALLVVGSSLAVYSGLRFVHHAKRRALPIAIVALGETRGDAECTLKLDASVGATLAALLSHLDAHHAV